MRASNPSGVTQPLDSRLATSLDAIASRLGLAEGVYAAMLSPPIATPRDRMAERALDQSTAVVWEELASGMFSGRMLSGCCNLGCIELSGAGESSLPTKLCSGFRRSRYCSIACQREAWLTGGHKLVCGRPVGML